MSEISEIIDMLEDGAMARLASITPVTLTTRQALSIVRAYRQQEAELAALRDQIKRAEEQEAVSVPETQVSHGAAHELEAALEDFIKYTTQPKEPK